MNFFSMTAPSTIELPQEFTILDPIPLDDPKHPAYDYLLSAPLTLSILSDIVVIMWKLESRQAYEIKKVPSGRENLLANPSLTLRCYFKDLQEKHNLSDIEMNLAQRVHFAMEFKRFKGICRNPRNPRQHIVALISATEQRLKWFDITIQSTSGGGFLRLL